MDNRRKKRKKIKHKRQKRLLIILLVLLLMVGAAGFVAFELIRNIQEKDSNVKISTITELIDIGSSRIAKANVLFAGDIMIHSPIYNSTFYHDTTMDTYDFEDIFKYIEEDYNSADYTICTFEGALGGGKYCGYPGFISPAVIMNNLQDAGIDAVNIASNHVYDGLSTGFHATMDIMDSIHLTYLGARQSTDVPQYHIEEINGIKVGITDYCYETGNYKTFNWIDVSDEDDYLINSFNYNYIDQFYSELQENYNQMIADGAEICLISLHWGTEYQLTESSFQDEMAQRICDIGFSAIIGSHPHVEQPVDVLTSTDGTHQTLVCYAIGNHLSNQRYEFLYNEADGQTEDGCMVNLTIARDKKGKVRISNVDFIYTWVYMRTENGSNQYYILALDDIDSLANETGITDLGTDPQDSINRSEAIMAQGIKKVETSLPIQVVQS